MGDADQGVMGIIVADRRWIDLMKPANSWVTGAVVSLYDIGCLVGAMSIGILADIHGRERTLSIACAVFIVGAVIQAASYTITAITIGRVVLGYGVGACAGGVPLYVSEIAPLLIVIKLSEFDYGGAAAIATIMLGISFLTLLAINLIQAWSRRRFGYV